MGRAKRGKIAYPQSHTKQSVSHCPLSFIGPARAHREIRTALPSTCSKCSRNDTSPVLYALLRIPSCCLAWKTLILMRSNRKTLGHCNFIESFMAQSKYTTFPSRSSNSLDSLWPSLNSRDYWQCVIRRNFKMHSDLFQLLRYKD